MQAKRQDVYIANPALLKGKPKETIGNYVREELGRNPFRKFKLMVPDIYGSFEIARQKWGFARSETELEYSGPSGLLHSVESRDYESEAKLLEAIFRGPTLDRSNCGAYCRYAKIDANAFTEGVSASYWQHIRGQNHSVVADSAVEGRYHIFTRERYAQHYLCIEGGNVAYSYGHREAPDMAFIKRLIEAYEYVRNLGNFDPQHCPIIELQTGEDGAVWFLQYHRTRDFKPASFRLERQPEEGESAVHWVRGATDTEKQLFKVLLFHGNLDSMFNVICPMGENWMHDGRNLPHYYESTMAGRRRLQIIPSDLMFICTHQEISRLIKPEITVLAARSNLVSDDDYARLWHDAYNGKQDQFILLEVSSDGRQAYTKRVG